MPLLELREVSKSFAGVSALEKIDLDVYPGEVHALIGANGAGKSTLIKLISGVFKADNGVIRFNNRVVSFSSPQEAKKTGIHTLYQEFNLLPQLTITENIFLGMELRQKYLPFLDWRTMRQQTRQLLDYLGLSLNPDMRVHELSIAERQLIEFAKILNAEPKLLLMDEPTSSLSPPEVQALFGIIKTSKENGLGIIYISHRLNEVTAVSDRITVLRDGRRIITVKPQETTQEQLTRLMLGKAAYQQHFKRSAPTSSELLRVEKLTHHNAFEDISFVLHAGEILGLAGLLGAGRTAIARAIFGMDLPDSGQIYVNGKLVSIQSPQDAVALGIGMLPADRQEQALLLDMSARENISLSRLRQTGPVINRRNELDLAQQYVQKLQIKMPSVDTKAKYLSGGTQQKVVLSRWLAIRPRILIVDEPTRGIDIGGKLEIYRLLNELAAEGIAILMISSEFSELISLCDTVLAIRSGHVVKSVACKNLTEEMLLSYILGEEVHDLQER